MEESVPVKPVSKKPVKRIHWKRISGIDRIQTALEVSKINYKKSKILVLATANNYPDALTASVLTGLEGWRVGSH